MFMPRDIEARPILMTWLVDCFGLGDMRPRRLSSVARLVERIAPTMMPIAIRF